MEITTMKMYWLVKLDDLQHAVTHLTWLPVTWVVITAIVAVVAIAAADCEDKDTKERVWRRIKNAMLLCIPMLFLGVVIQFTAALIPSTKQMAAIIVVPRIANNEKVQAAGNKLYELAVEWMEELKPTKESEVEKCR